MVLKGRLKAVPKMLTTDVSFANKPASDGVLKKKNRPPEIVPPEIEWLGLGRFGEGNLIEWTNAGKDS